MAKKASYLLLMGALLLLTALPTAQATGNNPPVEATPTPTQTITATPSPQATVTIPDKPNADHTTSQEIEFVGRITPQIVSAIVPCNIAFTMDPNQEYPLTTENGNVNLALSKVSSGDAKVVNSSIWPIRLSVTGVEVSAPAEGETAITLENDLNLGDNQVLLVLGEKEPNPADGTHIFESAEKFLKQALLADQATKDPLPILEVGAKTGAEDSVKSLWVYGKAKAGAEYTFTVTLTLRIDWVRKDPIPEPPEIPPPTP